MTGAPRPSDQLQSMLAGNEETRSLYQDDLGYHITVDIACQLVDAVGGAVDQTTAGLVTRRVYEWLSGDDSVAEATAAIAVRNAELRRLVALRPVPSIRPWTL